VRKSRHGTDFRIGLRPKLLPGPIRSTQTRRENDAKK
jgi:hypothetical protein